MRYPEIFAILVVIGCIILTGCTQSSGTSPGIPAVPETTSSGPGTPVPTAAVTSVPEQVVTIIHFVSRTKTIRDSEHLFALQVPVEWNVSTHQMMSSGSPYYRTDLIAGNVFTIYTVSITNNQDMAYRDEVRQWSPAPEEKTVVINTISYDRFESASAGKTNVSYIVRRISANERGYVNVITFSANISNRFEKEDFEKVVSSFRYFSGSSASDEPGEEIPLFDPAGKIVPGKAGGLDPRLFDTSDWDSGESSSDGDSSGGDSPGGSSDCGCTGGGP
ncbi:MAG: hypothetical protein WC379_10330 [Methanoregula sp.]|jgi:hypothetical protein